MIATLVLAFLVLSIFTGLIFSYRLSAHTRYRDHARYVLKSVGDEFLTRQAEDASGTLKPLFALTTSPTGRGVSWRGVYGDSMPNPNAGLKVTLGTSTGAVIDDALLTRNVTYLSDTGTVSLTAPASSAGVLLRGDFKIRYVFNKVPVEQSVSLVRRVP